MWCGLVNVRTIKERSGKGAGSLVSISGLEFERFNLETI